MTSDLPPFLPFGHAHLLAMFGVVVLAILLPMMTQTLGPRMNRVFALLIASVLVLNEVVFFCLDLLVYKLPLVASLPLQLCDIAALLTAWMLWRQSYRAFEIAWFWGVGGSMVAMLTPDLSIGYPHPLFIHFFIGHGIIMLGLVHASVAYAYRPVLRSVGKAIIASIILMLIVGSFNRLLDMNYMYLCAKPAQQTLMDYMGPWPWYLGSLVLAGSVVYMACYLPFVLVQVRRNITAIKN
jgi:hypothetical integral membrane protein (TIGR02206 family)